MDSCFKVIAESPIRNLMKIFAMGADREDWSPYYSFNALPIDSHFIDLDPTLKELRKKREFRAGVIQVPANAAYMWHVDTDRNASINMLIEDDGQSKCVFAPGELGIVTPIVELKYEPDMLYAFNTKVLHTVLNFSKPRYMFSVEFIGKDRDLDYHQLCFDLGLT